MEDTHGEEQIKSESRKSTGTHDGGHISSVNNSAVQILIKCESEESLAIKEEIVPDQETHHRGKHNLFSKSNGLEEKYITTEISSDYNSGAKTLYAHDYDETLEIKEEIIHDQQIKSESRKSTGTHDGGPYSFTTTHISSVNNPAAQILTKCESEEALAIKEEIVPDQESHRRGKHNLFSKSNELEEKYITAEISSDNNSGAKTLYAHDYDETLEIKEEIIHDLKMSDRDSQVSDIQEWQPKKKKNKLDLSADEIVNADEIVPASCVTQSTYHNSFNTTQRSQIIGDVIVERSDESTPYKKAFILPVKIASTASNQRELRKLWDRNYRKRNREFEKQRHKEYRERQKK